MEIALMLLGLGLAAAAPFVRGSKAARVLTPLPTAKERLDAWRDREMFANRRTEEEQLQHEARGKVIQREVWSLDYGAAQREAAFRAKRRRARTPEPQPEPAPALILPAANVYPIRRIS